MFQPQKKHKAQHGNYYQKPSEKGVVALMNLYRGISEGVSEGVKVRPVKKQVGCQLKLDI